MTTSMLAWHFTMRTLATTATELHPHFLGSVVVSSSSHTHAPWLPVCAIHPISIFMFTCVRSLHFDLSFLLLALLSAPFSLPQMKSMVNLHNSCKEGVDASDDLFLSTEHNHTTTHTTSPGDSDRERRLRKKREKRRRNRRKDKTWQDEKQDEREEHRNRDVDWCGKQVCTSESSTSQLKPKNN